MRWLCLGAALLTTLRCGQAFAVLIVSNSHCPSSEAVKERVVGLVENQGSDAARALIEVQKEVIHIEFSSYGERPRVRSFIAQGSCAERAESVALVIAAWLDAFPTNELAAPVTLPPIEPARKRATEAVPAVAPLSRRWWMGMGIQGMQDNHDRMLGLTTEIAFPRWWNSLGGQVNLSMSWPWEPTIGQGQAQLYRPTLVFALSRQSIHGAWLFMPTLGPSLGMLIVKGQGYDKNHTSHAWMWGANVGGRLARMVGKRSYWLGSHFTLWPAPPRVRSVNLGTTLTNQAHALSYWEWQLALGMSWQLF